LNSFYLQWLRTTDEYEVERELLTKMIFLLKKFDEAQFHGGETIVQEWKKELDKLLTKIQGGIMVRSHVQIC